MNEATDPTPDNSDSDISDNSNSSQNNSAFSMRVVNDEDSDHHLFIAETGSTKSNNSLLLTSDILSPERVKLSSQVPHFTLPAQPDQEPDQDNLRVRREPSTPVRHQLPQSSSKLVMSGSRNKRKNFQPRSIFIVDDNDDENHLENNSNEETNGEQSDGSDGLTNGKSSSESHNSVCHSSEGRPQESSHRQSIETSVTSITGIRRCASLQRNHSQLSALQHSHQSQPLDLSNQECDTKTNGQVVENDIKIAFDDIEANDKLSPDQSRVAITTIGAINPMDLSRKRSASDDDNDPDEGSADDEDVVDLRLNQILGLYGMKNKQSLVGVGVDVGVKAGVGVGVGVGVGAGNDGEEPSTTAGEATVARVRSQSLRVGPPALHSASYVLESHYLMHFMSVLGFSYLLLNGLQSNSITLN